MFAEAFGALISILDENDLKEFVSLPKQLKECQLIYFSKIISGIRLFNKDCGKGGAGIPKCKISQFSMTSMVKFHKAIEFYNLQSAKQPSELLANIGQEKNQELKFD